jgi:ubiquinone/menaquinone biosynthesis C-methylase UbiE
VNSSDIGQQYDEIAAWWNDRHMASKYGMQQVERALAFAAPRGKALDVGCGAGGRFVRLLEERGFEITGVDASSKMISLAQLNHPQSFFVKGDITSWDTEAQFDFILAWDCLFHLPLNMQKPVLAKLCRMLTEQGVMIHTFGDDVGEHTDTWRGQEFRYSSIGISQNIELLHENGLSVLHLELDQFPEKHVYAISRRS